MRRLFAALAATMVLLLAAPTTARAGTAVPEIVGVDTSRHPNVRVTVSVPGATSASLTAKRLKVLENGEPVDATVKSVGSVGVDVAIVLDASNSMVGARLAGAKAAAQGFIDALPSDARIAVVSFAEKPKLVTLFTSDREEAKQSIAGLKTAHGTAIFDAVKTAAAAFTPSESRRQLLVLLSDGEDTSSVATADEAAESMRSAGLQFTAIALGAGSTQMETLAEPIGGQVLDAANTAALADLYLSVAESLTSLVDVNFQSQAHSGSIDVSVAVDGGTPAVAKGVPLGLVSDTAVPTPIPAADSVSPLLNIPWLPWIGALLIAAGIIGCVVMLQGSTRRDEIEEMLSNIETPLPESWVEAENEAKAGPSKTAVIGDLAEGLTTAASRLLERQGRTASIDSALERAGISMRAGEMGAFVMTMSLAAGIMGFLLGGPVLGIIGLLVPAMLVPVVVKFLQGRRRKKFSAQLGDTLMLISGALKAGYGLGQAIDSVAVETPKPTSEEFSRVLMETRLGLSLEDSLDGVANRMQSEDFDWVVNAVKINATVGGDLSGLLDQVGETIRARLRIKRMIDALAAEGKISALVLFSLPPSLVGFIAMSNPAYIKPMFSSGLGHGILGASLVLMLMGGAWLKKIVSLKV